MKHSLAWVVFLMLAMCANGQAAASAGKSEAQQIIEKYDRNGDGLLSQEELVEYLNDKTLKRFDSNHDLIITTNEIRSDSLKIAQPLFEGFDDRKLNARDLRIGLQLEEPSESRSLLATVGEYVQLRKSFLTPDDDATDPAKLGWTVARHDSSYTFDGALSLAAQHTYLGGFNLGSLRVGVNAVPTVEAHVSNVDDAAADSLAFGVPIRFVGVSTRTNEAWNGHWLSATPIFETDSRLGVKTFRFESLYSPTIPSLAIGRGTANLFGLGIAAHWRPYVGFEVGRVIDDFGVLDLQDSSTFGRCVIRAHGELEFTTHFLIAGDLVHRVELSGHQHSYTYGELSPQYTLDSKDRLRFGATLRTGKDTPSFKDEHAANLWVGLKF
jgi:hypothetical protein